MAEHGTRRHFEEFAIHRSAYQLKEADPHTWALPRLQGAPKAALVTIQKDEYGDGDPEQCHAELFARTLRALGLSADYGAYLDQIPAITLSTVNLISFFGLHRRWRGALVGHLAIFEMASVGPNRNYSRALRRLGYDERATEFYDVHVVADEVHQRIARDDMAARLAQDEPEVAADILFGAEAVTAVEGLFTQQLLGAWTSGRSSLLRERSRRAPRVLTQLQRRRRSSRRARTRTALAAATIATIFEGACRGVATALPTLAPELPTAWRSRARGCCQLRLVRAGCPARVETRNRGVGRRRPPPPPLSALRTRHQPAGLRDGALRA